MEWKYKDKVTDTYARDHYNKGLLGGEDNQILIKLTNLSLQALHWPIFLHFLFVPRFAFKT